MITNDFYSPEVQGAYELHSLGEFRLEDGGVIPDLQLAVATYGELNQAKDNVVLITHFFSATATPPANMRPRTRRRATGTRSSAPARPSIPTGGSSSPRTRWST